jgi:hypothetical protein
MPQASDHRQLPAASSAPVTCMLSLGPDPRRTSRLRFRIVARRVRRLAPCLVWVAPDG